MERKSFSLRDKRREKTRGKREREEKRKSYFRVLEGEIAINKPQLPSFTSVLFEIYFNFISA